MSLWWIGNAVLLLVIVPVVVFLLVRVLLSAFRVRRRLAELAERGAAVGGEADGLGELERTRELVAEVRNGLARHADVLSQMAGRQ